MGDTSWWKLLKKDFLENYVFLIRDNDKLLENENLDDRINIVNNKLGQIKSFVDIQEKLFESFNESKDEIASYYTHEELDIDAELKLMQENLERQKNLVKKLENVKENDKELER